jgi:FKBP-type peptidyl-prolyl cis-trans isomerase FkpA
MNNTRTRIRLIRIFLTTAFYTIVMCVFACISGIALEENAAFAQPGASRAETDGRPVEPGSATQTPPKVTVKPASPVAKPVVKPTPKPVSVVKPTPEPTSLETSRKFPKIVTRLMKDDLQSGRGRATKVGSQLVVHYQSWLYDPTQPLGRGPQFESTIGKAPYKFVLQSPDLPHIKGWEDGLLEMKVGGKRRLIIPPELAYGANGAGQVVPAGATLLYEIELVDVE